MSRFRYMITLVSFIFIQVNVNSLSHFRQVASGSGSKILTAELGLSSTCIKQASRKFANLRGAAPLPPQSRTASIFIVLF